MGTSMKIEKESNSNGGGSSGSLPQLIEKNATVKIGASSTVYIPVDVDYHRYEIRTINATNVEKADVIISVYDKQVSGSAVYRSLREASTYDIVNVPCQDKDGLKRCHVFIENKSNAEVNVELNMKFTNLA